MKYQIEVQIADGFDRVSGAPVYRWAAVRPTGGSAYVFATRAEAARVRAMCYPDVDPATCRLVEVPHP